MNPARRILSLVLLAGVFVMEGFDINAMALAVPRLEGDLGLVPASFGWVFTALLVGIGIGGALLAPLGDRFGRRALIVIGCLVVAAATAGTSTASSINEFLLWRLLTGIALGAVLPNCSALSSELAPPRLRATIMALVSAGIPLGLAAAGIAAPAIIAASGWHGLFLVPAVFAAALAVGQWIVLEGGLPQGAADKAVPDAKLPQLMLFSTPWAFPFAVFAVLLALNALNLYLLNSWLPTVLPGAGLSLDDAARVAGIVQLAGLVVGLVASLLMDRWKPGMTLLLMFAAIAVCFAAIGLTAPDATRWTLLLSVGVGGASAGGMVLPSLCAYLFPARLLSSAVGMGVLVARLGAFAGPPLGGAMLAAKVAPQTFLGVAAIPAVICTLLCLAVPAALAVKGRVERENASA